jgi:protein TonB
MLVAALLLTAAQDIQIATPSDNQSLVPPPASVPAPETDAAWQRQMVVQLTQLQRYPPAAMRKGTEGTAQVRFRVDRSGRILSAELAHSSGSPDLDIAAVESVRGARLPPMPATMTGPMDFVLPLTFRLAD